MGGKRILAQTAPTIYLVTGADGFIGREICAVLRARNYRVRGLIHGRGRPVPLPEGVETVRGDVLEPDSLSALFADLDSETSVLIHTAAVISVKKRDRLAERTNVEGTKNMLAACKSYGVRRFIHLSSVDALPFPKDGSIIKEPAHFTPEALPTSYGRSKAAGSQLVLDAMQEGLDAVLLMPSCVIGPGDYRSGFVSFMLRLYLSGLPRLSIDGGYEFVDVRDVALAAVSAAEGAGSGCYLLSGGYESVTLVFDTLAAYTGRKKTLCTLPLFVLYPLAPLVSAGFRLLGRQPPLSIPAVQLLGAHPAYDHSRAARALGFSPRPTAESVVDAAKFILQSSGGKKA